MARIRVTAGARVHFGFQNLSLAHQRLYGGVGVALREPRVVVEATPASDVHCEDSQAAEYAERAVSLLDVAGAAIEVHERLPRHVGLGSGTQLALAVLAAIAHVHGRRPQVRERAPALGRGGRSGVGVATFEQGGFVLDAGHLAKRFTTAPPAEGEWTVPERVARHTLPTDWRFVVVVPEMEPGRSGEREERTIGRVVERADPAIADEVARLLAQRLLPAAATGAWNVFGSAIAEVSRLNGAWYADEQGGMYRPPLGELIERLVDSPAIAGAGQSSWGPAVYGLTDRDRADEALASARKALAAVDIEGEISVCAPRNEGARIESV